MTVSDKISLMSLKVRPQTFLRESVLSGCARLLSQQWLPSEWHDLILKLRLKNRKLSLRHHLSQIWSGGPIVLHIGRKKVTSHQCQHMVPRAFEISHLIPPIQIQAQERSRCASFWVPAPQQLSSCCFWPKHHCCHSFHWPMVQGLMTICIRRYKSNSGTAVNKSNKNHVTPIFKQYRVSANLMIVNPSHVAHFQIQVQ